MAKYRVMEEKFIDDQSFCVYKKEPGLEGFIRGWVYLSSGDTLEKAKELIAFDRRNPVYEA